MAKKSEWLSTTLGRVKTGQVAAVAMTKGTILNYTGTNKGDAAERHSIGILSHDVAIGDDTYVFSDGSVVLVQAADGSISVGDQLIPDSTQTGKATTGSSIDHCFGIALDASAALNDWIRVKLQKDITEIATGQVAAVAMTKGTILNYSGNNKGSAAARYSIGVLSKDAGVGESTYVYADGSIVLVQAANGSILVGDLLIPDGTAYGKATTGVSTNKSFGIALDASTALDDWIKVKLNRDIIP